MSKSNKKNKFVFPRSFNDLAPKEKVHFTMLHRFFLNGGFENKYIQNFVTNVNNNAQLNKRIIPDTKDEEMNKNLSSYLVLNKKQNKNNSKRIDIDWIKMEKKQGQNRNPTKKNVLSNNSIYLTNNWNNKNK